MRIIKIFLIIIFIMSTRGTIFSQGNFMFSTKNGVIFPFVKFHSGRESDANKQHQINTRPGFSSEIISTFRMSSKSNLNMAFKYESFKLNIFEYVKFPEDAFLLSTSYYYSNLSLANIALAPSFSYQLNKFLLIEGGVQFSIPLNSNYGYLYAASRESIVQRFSYSQHRKIAFISGIEIPLISKKNYALSLNPSILYYVPKTNKTVVFQNQLSILYFSVPFKITIK